MRYGAHGPPLSCLQIYLSAVTDARQLNGNSRSESGLARNCGRRRHREGIGEIGVEEFLVSLGW